MEMESAEMPATMEIYVWWLPLLAHLKPKTNPSFLSFPRFVQFLRVGRLLSPEEAAVQQDEPSPAAISLLPFTPPQATVFDD